MFHRQLLVYTQKIKYLGALETLMIKQDHVVDQVEVTQD